MLHHYKYLCISHHTNYRAKAKKKQQTNTYLTVQNSIIKNTPKVCLDWIFQSYYFDTALKRTFVLSPYKVFQ